MLQNYCLFFCLMLLLNMPVSRLFNAKELSFR
jgi:hypothetical protein